MARSLTVEFSPPLIVPDVDHGDAFAVTITITAVDMPAEVLVVEDSHAALIDGRPYVTPRFSHVCSPYDLVSLPADAPRPDEWWGYYRVASLERVYPGRQRILEDYAALRDACCELLALLDAQEWTRPWLGTPTAPSASASASASASSGDGG